MGAILFIWSFFGLVLVGVLLFCCRFSSHQAIFWCKTAHKTDILNSYFRKSLVINMADKARGGISKL